MAEELNLVRDLAVILISAGVFTVISKVLKQPLVLGYIVAGFLVGPHISFFPGISSTESVQQWSDIGIIFLLFALGLEFSFKKLLKVGSSALIIAGMQCLGMIALGIMLGQALGWSAMESVFLGGMLSMSSTAIVIKAYDDLGLKKAPYASTVFGTLVVQDLIAILLMVLLSTMAVSHRFSGTEMLMGIAKLFFFLILWFLVGIYVIPTLLQKAHKYMNDEILLLVSIGLCFGMVQLASVAGFSSALGAFVMGSILSETIEGEKISSLVGSIKNLFAAIFFVSVGMMVNPSVIVEHWGTILAITIAVLVGISSFATTGAALSGKGLENSVRCGFSLSQLGEFSFILAGLGVSLGVMREFVYPVIITVSVVTTFTTPYMIKASGPFAAWLHRKLPQALVERIDEGRDDSQNSAAENNEWKTLLRAQGIRVMMYTVILIAILLGSRLYLERLMVRLLPDASKLVSSVISTAVTLAIMLPFLVTMVANRGQASVSGRILLKQKPANVWPLLAISLLKMALAMVFVFTVLATHFELSAWAVVVVVLVSACAFLFFIRHSMKSLGRLEARFLENLNKKEDLARQNAPVSTSVREKMAGYDVHIEAVDVSADSSFVGLKLKDIPFRASTGANIVKIVRGSRSILIPSGDEVVYPHDRLLAVGTSEQLASFAQMVHQDVEVPAQEDAEFVVEPVLLGDSSSMVGRTLRELDMRASGCMVISVLHDGVLLTNPRADYRFAADDTVWLAGDKNSIEWYKK
ncbi:MAG: cation:proton antiporter [Bacteroidales bacterium]|nr:cation:proton antiporter [Bacteroidales bacterium]